MKKIFKKEVIIAFVIGVILASSIAVYATINASDIDYTRTGTNITKVSEALNDLYDKSFNTTLLWTNQNPTSDFPAQTLNLDFSKFDYILIKSKSQTTADGNSGFDPRYNLIQIGGSGSYILGVDSNSGYNWIRDISVTTSSISFSIARGRCYAQTDQNDKTNTAIPLNIYGIKYL